MQNNYKDIPVLNGLRGLAVLIVFASHASNIFYQGKITGWGGGQLGVMLFFVLSGFLMSHLYGGRPAGIAEQWRFIVYRFGRIYPLFAVIVLACFAIHRFGAPVWAYRITTLRDVCVHLLFIRGYNIFWTLGPEVIFYLLFLILWRAHRSSGVAFAVVAVAAVGVAWMPVSVTSFSSVARLHNTLPYFLVGSIIGLRSDQLIDFSGQRCNWTLVAFWVSLSVFALSFPEVIRLFADVPKQLTGAPWPDPWSFPFYLLATGCLFVTSILASPWVLTNPVAGFLGKISFSFYLLHYAVLQNVANWMPGHPARSIVFGLIVTILLSSFTYVIVETPMRSIIRRLGSRCLRTVQVTSA